jgi:AcrR family transcriptional regulator
MARTKREDWTTAGLEVLRDEGEHALTIERVCVRLSRTKGAFYHHFASLDAFHEALLAHWERQWTEAPIAASLGRATKLSDAVRALDHTLDIAVRAWALRSPRARAAVRRIDARRETFLASLWRAYGASMSQAATLARIEYAAFVGAQHVYPGLHGSGAVRLETALRRALQGLAAHALSTETPRNLRRQKLLGKTRKHGK